MIGCSPAAEDVYLKLVYEDDVISGNYATAPDQWERIGRFGNAFQFSRAGTGVTKSGSEEAVVGMFDYFQISEP